MIRFLALFDLTPPYFTGNTPAGRIERVPELNLEIYLMDVISGPSARAGRLSGGIEQADLRLREGNLDVAGPEPFDNRLVELCFCRYHVGNRDPRLNRQRDAR